MRSFQLGLFVSVAWIGTALATEPAVPIEAAKLSDHIRILSSDAFEGRGPATEGEKKSVAYISEQMKAIGLVPSPGGRTRSMFSRGCSRPIRAASSPTGPRKPRWRRA